LPVEQRLLNLRRQQNEIADLNHSCIRHAELPRDIAIALHPTFSDETLDEMRQGDHARDSRWRSGRQDAVPLG
jgi:hypothetical protein